MTKKEEKKHRLTETDFKLFKSECEKYRKKCGLDEWRFYYKFNNIPSGSMAQVRRNIESRSADFELNRFWDKNKYSRDEIIDTACHEVMHILVGELAVIGYNRFITEPQFDMVEERLIEKLVKIIK
jgi:hypothetical protein